MRLLILTVLLSHLLGLLAAGPFAADEQADTDQQKDRIQINIGRLREGIAQHEEKVAAAGNEESRLIAEVQRVEGSIAAHLDAMQELEEKILAQQTLIAGKEAELAKARSAGEEVRLHLEKRLRSFYLTGKTGFLNVIFSQHNLPDLMLFNDSFHSLVNYDQILYARYRTLAGQIEQSKQVHELEKAVQESFLEQAAAEKRSLEQVQQEKNALLASIKTRKGLYELALKEMKQAETDLAVTLRDLKQEQEDRERGFLLSKGKLPRPVEGILVRSFQGAGQESGDAAKAEANGITIKTVDKSKVRAVFRGKVIFAGYMRGYGKMIVIDHGLQYFTITARFEQFAVAEGDQVNQGQVLGTTGDLATLFSDGLYFEVRHGSTPEDPLDWLESNAYAAQ